AGLFAPLADVAAFARAMAGAPHHGAGRIDAAVAETCFASSAAPGTSWRLGWDTPSHAPGVSHAGDAWPREHAAGHLGFTGTSLWLDWARGRWAVLLTNRVHPSRARPEAALIKDVRRAFGDLAWALCERGL
ncbi:MAG: serine hydrolase, partial [Deltaproteobacteria bacterium]|nr:serine hydrolase [Kofleriaceae bacterium]